MITISDAKVLFNSNTDKWFVEYKQNGIILISQEFDTESEAIEFELNLKFI